MSIDAKIAEIMEESKLLGLGEEVIEEEVIEQEELDEDAIIEELGLSDYSIEDLEDFMMSEDFEQLDELSKKTLGSYVKKATSDVGLAGFVKGVTVTDPTRSKEYEHAASMNKKRKVGINKAVDKITKESIDVSADVDALMFGESLSEEFREKAATIFESAVVVRVKEEVARLEEEFEEKLAEQVDSITEGLVDKIDGYLDYIVEQWIEQNEIALESGIKTDIMESFITGMKGLFEEHYIDVPEEKYDVLGEMEAKIDALEEKLDEQVERNIDLKKSLSEATRKEIVKTISEGLTDTETEKFLALAEELTYDSEDSFQTKVQTIRENYFNGTKTTRSLVQSVVTDSPVDELNEDTQYQNIDPTVAAYVNAIKNLNN